MGLSVEDGLYLTTNDHDPSRSGDAELEVEIGAFLDGAPLDNTVVTPIVAEGGLLFFKITATDTDREAATSGFQPSGVFGSLEIDMMGDEDTGRMTLNHILSSPLDRIFEVDMEVEASLNLELVLELDGVSGLPTLAGDLVLDWGWSLEGGLRDPEIGLVNLRIDIGTFVSDFFYWYTSLS